MNRHHRASFFIWGAKIIWMIILSLPTSLLKKKRGKRVEFVTWTMKWNITVRNELDMSCFSMNVYENVSYHASCHFSILPHIWRTGFHTRTLHALQRSVSVVSIIHVYIITIATCHSHETLHGCQKQQFWLSSQVITNLILHIARDRKRDKKSTNRCA